MATPVAHVLTDAADGRIWTILLALFTFVLVIEHAAVAGGWTRVRRVLRNATWAIGAASLAAAMGLVAPLQAIGQPGLLLPDLVSDPPRPGWTKDVMGPDGPRLVITFDGYVHNIGDGPLEVTGNPQRPGGMAQLARRGSGWEEVARPPIQYETEDGHNHFHLMGAVDYFLWDGRSQQLTEHGSKVGFCLVDSEQMEPGFEQAYSEEKDSFCQENNPGATELRMGISPGWRDVYDATTTLQWIDISDVAPGRYWIAALTDVDEVIVESNEDNNEAVFSQQPITVPGWTATDAKIYVEDRIVEFELTADAFGTVGAPLFEVVTAPETGWLSVAPGTSFTSGRLRWRPEPGFSGIETLEFAVRDRTSAYPFNARTATVTLEVLADASQVDGPGTGGFAEPPTLTMDSTFFEPTHGQGFRTTARATSEGPADRLAFSARGLPPGLVIDEIDGEISGAPLRPGIYESQIAVRDDAGEARRDVTWIVKRDERPPRLDPLSARQGPAITPVRLRIGPSRLDTTYSATGLPPGFTVDPRRPFITGRTTVPGRYDVVVTGTDADGASSSQAFSWVIEVAPIARFPL